MEKLGAGDVSNRWSDLLPGMNHIDAKRIDSIAADIVSVDARYQHLTLVIVDEQTTNHLSGRVDREICTTVKQHH